MNRLVNVLSWAGLFVMMACLGSRSTVATSDKAPETWAGTMTDSAWGTGTLRLSLKTAEGVLNREGTFDGQVAARHLTGTVLGVRSGSTVTLQLYATKANPTYHTPCIFIVDGVIRGSSLTGTYVQEVTTPGFCGGPNQRGSVPLTRQSN